MRAKLETSTAPGAIFAGASVNGPLPDRQTPLVDPEIAGSPPSRSQKPGLDHRPQKLGESREATGPPPASAGLRFLNYDDLKRLKGITYCRVHLQRLEDDGSFPQRVHIGTGRIGWLEREIDAWIEARAAARRPRPAPAISRRQPAQAERPGGP
jgi:prophage regulatory protein